MVRAVSNSSPEFPILVYRDAAVWVAQCLLTATTAVNAEPEAATREVSRLLVVALEDALDAAKGDLNEALRSITCPATPELWRSFFFEARPLAVSVQEPTTRPKQKSARATTRPVIRFTARKVA